MNSITITTTTTQAHSTAGKDFESSAPAIKNNANNNDYQEACLSDLQTTIVNVSTRKSVTFSTQPPVQNVQPKFAHFGHNSSIDIRSWDGFYAPTRANKLNPSISTIKPTLKIQKLESPVLSFPDLGEDFALDPLLRRFSDLNMQQNAKAIQSFRDKNRFKSCTATSLSSSSKKKSSMKRNNERTNKSNRMALPQSSICSTILESPLESDEGILDALLNDLISITYDLGTLYNDTPYDTRPVRNVFNPISYKVRVPRSQKPKVKPSKRLRIRGGGETQPQMNISGMMPSVPVNIGITTDLQDTIDELLAKIDKGLDVNVKLDPKIHEMLSLLETKVEGITSSVSGCSSNITKFATELGILVSVITAMIYHINNNTQVSLTILVSVLSVSLVKLELFKLEGIKDFVISVYDVITEYIGSSAQISSAAISSLVKSITVMVCGYLTMGKASPDLVSTIMTQMLSFKRNSDSIESFVNYAMDIISSIVNYVRVDVLGLTPLRFVQTNVEAINDFLDKVLIIETEIHNQTFLSTIDNADRVFSILKSGKALLASIPRSGPTASAYVCLLNAVNALEKLEAKLTSMNLNQCGTRVETVALLLMGPPGTGKSVMVDYFIAAIGHNFIPDEFKQSFKSNPEFFIHNRQFEGGFWSGYNMHSYICKIDDLGQCRDVAGNPDNEFMNVIRMLGISEYILNMADLGSKGSTRFNSKFLIATTNMNKWATESLLSSEALKRRFNCVYYPVPKVEYSTDASVCGPTLQRHLDYSKLPLGVDGVTSLNPSIHEYHEMDLSKGTDGEPTGKIFTFQEVCDQVVNVYNRNQLRHAQYKKEVQMVRVAAQGFWDQPTTANMTIRSSVPSDVLNQIKSRVDSHDKAARVLLMVGMFELKVGRKSQDVDEAISWCVHTYGSNIIDLLDMSDDDVKLWLHDESDYLPYVHREGGFSFLSWSTKAFSNFITTFKAYFTDIKGIWNSSKIPCLGASFKYIIEQMKSNLPYILGAVTLLVASGAAAYLYKRAYSIIKPMVEMQYAVRSNKTARKDHARIKSVLSKSTKPEVVHATAQGPTPYDGVSVQISERIMRTNHYRVTHSGNVWGFATALRGRVFMLPHHFIERFATLIEENADNAEVLVDFALVKSDVVAFRVRLIDLLNVSPSEDLYALDVALVEMPDHVRNHCDVLKYFFDEETLSKKRDSYRIRLVVAKTSTAVESWMSYATLVENYVVSGPEEDYTIRRSLMYNSMTVPGSCGSLLTMADAKTGNKKVLGIHVAGNVSTGTGVSAIFSVESLEKAMAYFKDQIIEEETSYPQSDVFINKNQFCEIGVVENGIHAPSKSKIIPSELHNSWGPSKCAPAKLAPFFRDGLRISPMDNALSKYKTNPCYVNPINIKLCANVLFSDLERNSVKRVERRILTVDESLFGIEDEIDFTGINTKTSPGWPENVRKDRLHGKEEWLGRAGVFTEDNAAAVDELTKEVLSTIEKARNNVRDFHVFADVLKDERRTMEKVEVGKTRMVSACPFNYLIIVRMYFGSYVLWCQKNRVHNGFAVGLNPFGAEWNLLASKLNKFAQSEYLNKGAGDYSGFDTNEMPQIHNLILDGINEWYDDGPENARIRRVLWLEVTQSKHITGNIIYEWFGSLPSGHPLTTLINNHYNHICFRYCWFAHNNFDLQKLIKFNDFVYLCTLGDDNIYSVDVNYTSFTEDILAKYMADIGQTYTSETKGVASLKMRPLESLSFLKRKFRYEPIYGRYAAPIDLDVILETPYWTKNTAEARTITVDNLNTSIRELALHDKVTFDQYYPVLRDSLQKNMDLVPKFSNRTLILLEIDGLEEHY